jgi:hypothetical protein
VRNLGLTGEVIVVGEGLREDPITLLEEYGFVKRTGPNSLILLLAAFCQLPPVMGHPWSGDVGHSWSGDVCHFD